MTSTLRPLTRLRPHPANPRRDLGDLTALAAELRAKGRPDVDLIVLPSGDVLDGCRRLAAAHLAELIALPCVEITLPNAAAELAFMTRVNAERENLTLLDRCDAAKALCNDVGPDESAALLGLPVSRLRDLVALSDLPDVARMWINTGRLLESHALVIARRKPAERAAIVAWLDEGYAVDDGEEIRAFDGRAIARAIQEQARPLSPPPFDLSLSLRVDGAVGCSACPDNSANDRQTSLPIIHDAPSGAVCRDTACYARNLDLAWTRRVGEAVESGRTVIADDAEGFDRRAFVALTDEIDDTGEVWASVVDGVDPVLWRDPLTGIAYDLVDKVIAAEAIRVARPELARRLAGERDPVEVAAYQRKRAEKRESDRERLSKIAALRAALGEADRLRLLPDDARWDAWETGEMRRSIAWLVRIVGESACVNAAAILALSLDDDTGERIAASEAIVRFAVTAPLASLRHARIALRWGQDFDSTEEHIASSDVDLDELGIDRARHAVGEESEKPKRRRKQAVVDENGEAADAE